MHEWRAEFEVDEALARELVSRYFAPRSLRPLAEGWDNAVWLVDERWAFRFPRREMALAGIRRERAVLDELAGQLPLPVPRPVFSGDDPWPFFGAELIPGDELPDARADRVALGRELGSFLCALHRARVGVELPDDPMGRADMTVRVPRTIESLEQIGCPVPRWVEDARDLGRPEPTCVAHGDLHFRHVLVDGGAASGVIDWGDVCRGDPAIDLMLYWSALPPAGRSEFLAAYGPVSEERLLRARVLSLNLCAVLARYGAAEGMRSVEREARAGLERTSVS